MINRWKDVGKQLLVALVLTIMLQLCKLLEFWIFMAHQTQETLSASWICG